MATKGRAERRPKQHSRIDGFQAIFEIHHPQLDGGARLPACGFPFLFKFELTNPVLDIAPVEFTRANSEYTGGIFDLALRLSELRPLELREKNVLRSCNKNADSMKIGGCTPIELLAAEGPGLTYDEIHFPACCQIYYVELRLSRVRFERGIQINVVFTFGKETGERSQLIR